eukprot:276192-Pleurochrysis_carterae.AAC.2
MIIERSSLVVVRMRLAIVSPAPPSSRSSISSAGLAVMMLVGQRRWRRHTAVAARPHSNNASRTTVQSKQEASPTLGLERPYTGYRALSLCVPPLRADRCVRRCTGFFACCGAGATRRARRTSSCTPCGSTWACSSLRGGRLTRRRGGGRSARARAGACARVWA